MTFEVMFSNINTVDKVILKSNGHKSLMSIIDPPFFVHSNYKDIKKKGNNPRVKIISAPGAAGKSTLARFISYKYNALYWDLSEIKLGDNSFKGTLLDSMDMNTLSKYVDDLRLGKTFLVIDALDEAEIISGKKEVDNLLDDINEICMNSKHISFVMTGRTETAAYVIEYCEKHNIEYDAYEIDFLPIQKAKEFIKNKVNLSIHNDTLVDQIIEAQFATIKRLLVSEEAIRSFLGYPPVLETLAQSFDYDDNTMHLLNSISDVNNDSSVLVGNILDGLLEREHEKMQKALEGSWAHNYPDFKYNDLYESEEQLNRVLEYIVVDDVECYYGVDIPKELKNEYISKVKSFLPQHPFLRWEITDSNDFAGPAFRDYTIAKMVSTSTFEELVDDYISKNFSRIMPTRLFFDFLYLNGDKAIDGKYFPLLYDSYKAKETDGQKAFIKLVQNDENIVAFCSIVDIRSNRMVEEKEVYFAKSDIWVNRLCNITMDLTENIVLGGNNQTAQIVDSVIKCHKLVIRANDLYVRSTKLGGCLIESDEEIDIVENGTFNVHVDAMSTDYLMISAPNAKIIYNFRKYAYDYESVNDDNLVLFASAVDKIVDCLRKHRKDAPARHREYIDNVIVSKNTFKQKVLNSLIELKILYTDRDDPRQYKLDVEKYSSYGLGWQSFVQYGASVYQNLFNECKKIWSDN